MPRFNFSPIFVAYSLDADRYTNLRFNEMLWGDNIADDEVVAIWERYRSQTTSTPDVEVITALTKRFAQLVGHLESWLRVNFSKNSMVSDSVLCFIVDCLTFANGGSRDYSISTWYDLVDVKSSEDGDCVDRKQLLSTVHIPTTEELLSNWLSREGGVDDFFVSVNILFGNR